MDILYLLIPIGLLFLAIAIKLLFWAVNSGQYDDLNTEGQRILFDKKVSADSITGLPKTGLSKMGDTNTEKNE
jgi:cbb3-type cytochrome oxidase maturation protein